MFFSNESIISFEDIEYICKLAFDILKTPVYFLNSNKEIVFSFSHGYVNNPLYKDTGELLVHLLSEFKLLDFPVIKSTRYFENYLAVNLENNNNFYGSIIIGPSTYSPVSGKDIDKIIYENHIASSQKRDLINFYNFISIIDYTDLLSAGQLLYYAVYKKKLEASTIIYKNRSLKDVPSRIHAETQCMLTKNRQDFSFHHTQNREKRIFQSIREGNLHRLKEEIHAPLDGKYGLLSKGNPLRNKKNTFICSATLATRAAIDGGLDTESAYSLSDSYIQNAEEINDVNDLIALQDDMLCDFAGRVSKAKELNYSKAVILCQDHVSKHLYDNISLCELAKLTGLTQNYLSELFSKEVGIPLSGYIQKERIEEAKRLLSSSNYSIIDIANWLNFHDQSHFTRVFKKFCNITPKKYRSKGR